MSHQRFIVCPFLTPSCPSHCAPGGHTRLYLTLPSWAWQLIAQRQAQCAVLSTCGEHFGRLDRLLAIRCWGSGRHYLDFDSLTRGVRAVDDLAGILLHVIFLVVALLLDGRLLI